VTISAKSKGRGFFLPFLGEVQELNGVEAAGRASYTLPQFPRVQSSGMNRSPKVPQCSDRGCGKLHDLA